MAGLSTSLHLPRWGGIGLSPEKETQVPLLILLPSALQSPSATLCFSRPELLWMQGQPMWSLTPVSLHLLFPLPDTPFHTQAWLMPSRPSGLTLPWEELPAVKWSTLDITCLPHPPEPQSFSHSSRVCPLVCLSSVWWAHQEPGFCLSWSILNTSLVNVNDESPCSFSPFGDEKGLSIRKREGKEVL